MERESGFTLIELLVSLSVVSVLTLNSLQMFSIYKQQSYDTVRDKLIRDTTISMEVSKSNFDNSMDDSFWIGSDAQGVLDGWHWNMEGAQNLPAQVLLPGLNVKPDTRMSASLNGWCNAANFHGCGASNRCCITESIFAYHCKGKKARILMTWNNGQVDEFEWDHFGC